MTPIKIGTYYFKISARFFHVWSVLIRTHVLKSSLNLWLTNILLLPFPRHQIFLRLKDHVARTLAPLEYNIVPQTLISELN